MGCHHDHVTDEGPGAAQEDPTPIPVPDVTHDDPRMQRALGFLRHNITMIADQVRAIDGAWQVQTPSLPEVWFLNHVRFAGPVTYAEAVAAAQRQLEHLPYLHVVLEHNRTGAPLEAEFQAAGWKIERELVMALARFPARWPSRSRTPIESSRSITPIECDEEDMLALFARWCGEEYRTGIDQLVEASRREGRAWNERRFTVHGEDGRPAALAKLRSDTVTAQVEDVYTVPEARGRGFARALVTHAAQLARSEGHALTFIVADDDDWPQHLYREIGFEPLGCVRACHRDRPSPSPTALPGGV